MEKVIALIVEDYSGVRRLLRSALYGIADEIFECCDGAGALAAYIRHQPDIVLMDIQMPMMDGFTATRQIKESYPAACILIVTDHDEEAVRTAAFAAGASGYALKQDLAALEPLILQLLATVNENQEKKAGP